MSDLDRFLDNLQEDIERDTEEHYGPVVLARWKDPKYIGIMEDANAVGGSVGECGDGMEVYLRVVDGVVAKAGFITDGCGPSLVSGETLCMMVEGRTLDQAAEVDGQTIINDLGGLPEEKEHCAHVAALALARALEKARAL